MQEVAVSCNSIQNSSLSSVLPGQALWVHTQALRMDDPWTKTVIDQNKGLIQLAHPDWARPGLAGWGRGQRRLAATDQDGGLIRGMAGQGEEL